MIMGYLQRWWARKTGKPEKLDPPPLSESLFDFDGEAARGHPAYDPDLRCADHPKAGISFGYGLAGGGVGPYTYCNRCSCIVSKSVRVEKE